MVFGAFERGIGAVFGAVIHVRQGLGGLAGAFFTGGLQGGQAGGLLGGRGGSMGGKVRWWEGVLRGLAGPPS